MTVSRNALRNRLARAFRALNIFVGQTPRVSGVEYDSDRRHLADISVRGSRRNQQEIAGVEHVFSLVGQRCAPPGELKSDLVLTETAVIDSLRVGAVRGF